MLSVPDIYKMIAYSSWQYLLLYVVQKCPISTFICYTASAVCSMYTVNRGNYMLYVCNDILCYEAYIWIQTWFLNKIICQRKGKTTKYVQRFQDRCGLF